MEPASSIITAFGGHRKVADIVGCHRTRPYMWEKPREQRGAGGVIPNKAAAKLLKYAVENGLPVGPQDFFPKDSFQSSAPVNGQGG